MTVLTGTTYPQQRMVRRLRVYCNRIEQDELGLSHSIRASEKISHRTVTWMKMERLLELIEEV